MLEKRTCAPLSSRLRCCFADAVHPTSKQSHPAATQYTILDEALAKPEYADAIKQAERDLPDDEWADKPFRQNMSREQRDYRVATNILAEIEPKLKQLSVTELVRSLKIEYSPAVDVTNNPTEVAEDVYLDGFDMIKTEIQSRPKKDLEVLPSLADDRVWLFTGSQGPPETLESFVHAMTNSTIPNTY